MAEADDVDRQLKLAQERTVLAQERTVLAHIRTGFASFLFGAALHGLFDTQLTVFAAWFFIAVGALFLAMSGRSYLLSRKRTRKLVTWRPGSITGRRSSDTD